MKRWVRSIPWLLVCLAMIISLVRLESVVHELNAEKSRAIYAECTTLKDAIKPLHDIVVFATKPADLTGLTGDRLAVVQAANASRVQARKDILPLIPTIECKKTSS